MPTDTITSLSAAATDETIGAELAITGFDRVGWIVVTSSGVTAGTVTIEWSATSGNTGNWARLDAISTTAATTTYGDSATAVAGFVRARISDAIVGGTVTVYLSRANTGF